MSTYESRGISRECLRMHPSGSPLLKPSRSRPTRAIAGPSPLQSAATPSAAIVLRAQSMNPEYVPVGADCILDLMTCEKTSYISSAIGQFTSSHIWRNSDGPHRDTSRATRHDNRTKVELGWRLSCWSQHLLGDLICCKVPARSLVRR